MAKIIYAYFNKNDLIGILNLLTNNGWEVYNEDRTIAEVVPAISNDLLTFYIGLSDEVYIEFTPCTFLGGYLQCGTFRIGSNGDAAHNAFLLIKRYIRKNYMFSQDKMFYIGLGVYRDWIDKKYRFPVLFLYDEFTIAKSSIVQLFDEILKAGYTIKANNVRLRNVNSLDLAAEAFVIFKEQCNLSKTIIRKSIVRYEYDSECIFVYAKNKSEYMLLLDKRIADNLEAELTVLFKRIERSYSSKE